MLQAQASTVRQRPPPASLSLSLSLPRRWWSSPSSISVSRMCSSRRCHRRLEQHYRSQRLHNRTSCLIEPEMAGVAGRKRIVGNDVCQRPQERVVDVDAATCSSEASVTMMFNKATRYRHVLPSLVASCLTLTCNAGSCMALSLHGQVYSDTGEKTMASTATYRPDVVGLVSPQELAESIAASAASSVSDAAQSATEKLQNLTVEDVIDAANETSKTLKDLADKAAPIVQKGVEVATPIVASGAESLGAAAKSGAEAAAPVVLEGAKTAGKLGYEAAKVAAPVVKESIRTAMPYVKDGAGIVVKSAVTVGKSVYSGVKEMQEQDAQQEKERIAKEKQEAIKAMKQAKEEARLERLNRNNNRRR